MDSDWKWAYAEVHATSDCPAVLFILFSICTFLDVTNSNVPTQLAGSLRMILDTIKAFASQGHLMVFAGHLIACNMLHLAEYDGISIAFKSLHSKVGYSQTPTSNWGHLIWWWPCITNALLHYPWNWDWDHFNSAQIILTSEFDTNFPLKETGAVRSESRFDIEVKPLVELFMSQ